MSRLVNWAQKNTQPDDLIVLEASGNSFHIVRTLAGIDRQALVLESAWVGKLKEAYANNDKISSVRIAKAFLSGQAKVVWVPDAKTQERRDCWHAYTKAIKRSTQLRNRIGSYLSDHGVRIKTGLVLVKDHSGQERIAQARSWSPSQWQVIEGMILELRHAEEQRTHWRRYIATEVLNDPLLLSLVRLCGIRDVLAFALGAIVGDIQRFARPQSLVNYIGLYPAFDESGINQWRGGVGIRGRKDLRALLIQGAQAILRSSHPLAQWGKKLLARKGSKNLAVAAIARKLTISAWYLMMGRFSVLEEVDGRLQIKLNKIITQMGSQSLRSLGKKRALFRQEIIDRLKRGRTYILDPNKTWSSQPNNLGDFVPQTP